MRRGFILLPEPTTSGRLAHQFLASSSDDLKCAQRGERETAPVLVQLKFIQNIERHQRTSSSTVIINSGCLYCPGNAHILILRQQYYYTHPGRRTARVQTGLG